MHYKKCNLQYWKLPWLPLLICTAAFGNTKPVQAQTTTYTTTNSTTTTKFDIYYGPETTLEQIIGMELAANVWSHFLSDNVTIKLFATTTNALPTQVLGAATPEMLVPRTSYETFRNKLYADRKSQNDFTAYNNLQKSSRLYAMANDQVVSSINYINTTRANAKALGMLSNTNTDFDGHIVLNKDLTNLSTDLLNPLQWSYAYTNNEISSNSLDFLTTVVHEMGHVLGFVSGVDNPNLITAIKNNKTTGATITDDVVEQSITPLDLYRFSSKSKDKVINRDESPDIKGIIDLSIGGDAFFTFDNGLSKVEDMARGEDTTLGGDGDQASHWQKGKNSIMDPYLEKGKRDIITDIDLTALDLIGWNVRSQALGLDQFAAILPNLYNQAKATAEYKLANASTWFLLAPPEVVNVVGVDNNSTYASYSCRSGDDDDDDDDDEGGFSCQSSTTQIQDSQGLQDLDDDLDKFCKTLENYNESLCMLWRGSAKQEYLEKWEKYYQKMSFLHQKWQPDTATASDTKSIPEPSATFGLLGLAWLTMRLKKQKKQATGG